MSASNESQRRDSSSGGRNRNRSRNRSRNRNRDRDGSQERNQDRSQERSRSRTRPRRPRVVKRKPTLIEKILTFITFGLYEPDLVVRSDASAGPAEDRRPSRDREEAQASSPDQRPLRERNTERSGRREMDRDRDRDRDRERDRERTPREKRPPESAEVTTERLYVGNLDYETTEADLYDLFNGVGKVKDAEVVCHKYTQRSKGYAFVMMSSVEEAKRAVEVLNNKAFMGRELWVSGAKSTGPKDAEDVSSEDESRSQEPDLATEENKPSGEISGREAVA